MYLYHPTFLVICLNIAIVLLLGYVGFVTSNPLVVLGLLLLQQTPMIDPTSMVVAMGGAQVAEEVEKIDHESSNHRIGFLANVK